MAEPWKNDRWFVSPWNYTQEVVSGLNFPKSIQFHDVTLRDGEQQAGIIFRKDEKIRIAEKLAEAGMHRIEAGMPAVSKQDEAAIREIVKRKLGPKVFAFCRCVIDDVKLAADCGVDGIVIEIPSSDHMIQYAYDWPLEKAIDLSVRATAFAHEQGLYTVFFPIDASRADIGWLMNLIEKVATEGHMDAFAMVDTFGVLAPTAIPYFVKKVRERLSVPLEAHFHDDFSCGAANTLLALAAGCEVVHSTVTAVGERAGNAPYEDVALALLTLYGIDTGIKTEKMYELSKLVQELAGIQVRPNRAIVGDTLFNIESGIIAGWVKTAGKAHELEVTPYLPSLVGQTGPRVVMGKNSGLPSMELWIDKLGLAKASEEQMQAMVLLVKEKAMETKKLLSEDDFKAIYDKVMR